MRQTLRYLAVVCTVVSAMCGLASSAQAQFVAVAPVRGSTDSVSQTGGQLVYFAKRPKLGSMTRLGLGFTTGVGRTIGVTGYSCGGFAPAEDCEREPLEVTRQLATVSLGLAGHLYRRSSAAVLVSGDAVLGAASISQFGTVSRRREGQSKPGVGVRIGTEAWWFPVRRWPVGLQLGASAEGLAMIGTPFCADCWDPFNGNVGLLKGFVGVVVGRRSRMDF